MVGAHRLPLRFDPGPLLGDVRAIEERAEWIDHWVGSRGDWRVIPLVTSSGDHRSFESIHFTGGVGKPTRILACAPNLGAAIAAFQAPVLHARLSRLEAHTSIHPHRDYGYYGDQRFSFERGFVRVHVPILSDDRVRWLLAGERIDMQPGEAWYLNVCMTHAVENGSDRERIHLVLDVEVNDWLRRLFPDESWWDKLRGLALRRLERPLWRLVKPFSGGVRQRRGER